MNLTHLADGGFYALLIHQDTTGGALLTHGSGCAWLTANGGDGGTFPLTTSAGAVDLLVVTVHGGKCYASVTPNFAQ